MTTVDLSQFASLFEIGFALHFAVAFVERIYAKELPVRIKTLTSRAKSLEHLKKEIAEYESIKEKTGETLKLRFAYRTVEDPLWTKHNDFVLDRIYALRQDLKGQTKALRRILSIITFLSALVLLYSVTILFMIGLDMELVKGLDPMIASSVVLMQLLPLPIAAIIFFLVARRMSHEVDRKIRGIGELQLMLHNADVLNNGYASVEQVFRRAHERHSFMEDS